MRHNNIQLVFSFTFTESRVKKITNSLSQKIGMNVQIIAIEQNDLAEFETLGNGVNLWRVKLKSSKLPRNLFTSSLKIIELFTLILAKIFMQRVDSISVRKVELLPIAAIFSFLKRTSLFYDVHELETEQAGQSKLMRRAAVIVEKVFLRFCDKIIVVSPDIAEWYRKKYNFNAVIDVKNCPEYRNVTHQKERNRRALRDEFGLHFNKIVLMYVGALFEERNIKSLLDMMLDDGFSQYALVFVGYGEQEREIKEHPLYKTSIFLKPPVKQEHIVDTISGADVSIMLPVVGNSLSHDYSLPNKFFESIMAQVPFISTDIPSVSEIIRKYKIGGIVTDHNDFNEIRTLIEGVLNNNRAISKRLERAALNFCWEIEEKKLTKFYQPMISS